MSCHFGKYCVIHVKFIPLPQILVHFLPFANLIKFDSYEELSFGQKLNTE